MGPSSPGAQLSAGGAVKPRSSDDMGLSGRDFGGAAAYYLGGFGVPTLSESFGGSAASTRDRSSLPEGADAFSSVRLARSYLTSSK
jgi:hypothetical protein